MAGGWWRISSARRHGQGHERRSTHKAALDPAVLLPVRRWRPRCAESTAIASISTAFPSTAGRRTTRAFRVTGSYGNLALALFSFALAAGLAIYIVWFARNIRSREEEDRRRRKLIRPLIVPVAVWVLSTRFASACSVCYGEAEGPMIDGARMGVYLLFGMVLAVQVSFVIFFLCLRKRARAHSNLLEERAEA